MATKLCTRCYAGMDTDGDGDCGVCAKLTDRQLAGIQDAAQKFKLPYAPTRPARETFITNAIGSIPRYPSQCRHVLSSSSRLRFTSPSRSQPALTRK